MRVNYVDACQTPEQLRDSLTVNFQDNGLHHFTLFYYDLDGRLIRTIPPKGVDRNLTYSRNTDPAFPAHQYPTDYHYNSQGMLMSKVSPDNGTVQYWYDFLGRIRMSQNSAQAAQGKWKARKDVFTMVSALVFVRLFEGIPIMIFCFKLYCIL